LETFHDNPFISTWVHMRRDGGYQPGVAEDLDLPGYDTESLGLYFVTSGGSQRRHVQGQVVQKE
jgi:hypothetical protein